MLINVPSGDMTLVGPRPLALSEMPDFEDEALGLSVKPGLFSVFNRERREDRRA